MMERGRIHSLAEFPMFYDNLYGNVVLGLELALTE